MHQNKDKDEDHFDDDISDWDSTLMDGLTNIDSTMNAREELITILETSKKRGFYLVCAEITYEGDYDEPNELIRLPLHHTEDELNRFYNLLDFNYNNGYGTQHLYGRVWLTYGAWLERWEYDGSEGWELKTCPMIPDYLRKNLDK